MSIRQNANNVGNPGTTRTNQSGNPWENSATDNTVRTTESGGNSEAGDIVLNAALDIEATAGSNTLTLDAHDDIEINEAVADMAGGAELALVLDAGGDVNLNADVTLRGGSLRTAGNAVNVSTGGQSVQVLLDGVPWTVDAAELGIGDLGSGSVTVRNGGFVDATGSTIAVAASSGTTGALVIESGADVMATNVVVGRDADASGTVTVTGSGSMLTTTGTDNAVVVGGEGTGTLEVLDGGLVETLWFDVGRSGAGRAVIRGIAADGSRSRVTVSPARGQWSGDDVDLGGFARVGRDSGSQGALEILEGGLLQVRDDRNTYGPGFHLARHKGSTGTLLIDGSGSSLEVIQDGSPDLAPFGAPYAYLGSRGGGTTTIRNGGALLVQGREAFVDISWDGVDDSFPDPDAGPIDQRSVVNILSGGVLEVDGEGARFVIGNGGPAADGTVAVSGPGSMLTVAGADNAIVVGGDGTGTLEVLDGGLVETLWLEVGRSGVGRAVIRGIAADGSRSRVMVSPARGRWSGDAVDEGGFVRVGRYAGSQGALEILEGGLLRVRDDPNTSDFLTW